MQIITMSEKKVPPQRQSAPGPAHIALIGCLITVILLVNGYFEINRTRRSLQGILENQATTLLRGLEREIQSTVSTIEVMESVPGGLLLNMAASTTFFALEDAVVDHLLGIATAVDQRDTALPLSPPDLEGLAGQEEVQRIEILREPATEGSSQTTSSLDRPLLEGSRDMAILPFKELLPAETDLFSVAVRRNHGEGIVVVSIDYAQMKHLRRRFAVQSIVETTGFTDETPYISIYDRSLSPIAEAKGENIDTIRDEPFLRLVQESGRPQYRFYDPPESEEVFEVAKVLQIEGEPYGIIQIGLSTHQIQGILSQSKRNVTLSVAVLLAFGLVGVILISINQNRHLRRIREMEQKAQATERLLSIGKLGAGLAHEIRNPLNAIGMGIQRLHREFIPEQENRAKEYGQFIAVIRDEIKRLNQLVDRFLVFSKPDKLALASTSLKDVLDNLSVLFAEEAQARSIMMEKALDLRIPKTIIMDRERITQALINLVGNSFHAMEDRGSVKIEAKMDEAGWVRIVVSDTGKGIDGDRLEKVFDYSYTTREKGLGLGLPIVQKIVEEHGGRITIESQVEKGTTVSILLPIRGPAM